MPFLLNKLVFFVNNCNNSAKKLNGASQQLLNQGLKAGLHTLIFSLILIHSFGQNGSPPIGQWREHLWYQGAIKVLVADEIYCATANNVFKVDDKNEITRLTKMNGLNDVGVSTIGFDSASQQLVICYNNSNVDVVKGRIVRNIGDIKRSTISGDKSISDIFCKDKKAYLSTGLGIIVADLERLEIKDTWFIGDNGNPLKVNGFSIIGDRYFAATVDGLKWCSMTSNPGDYRNWTTVATGNARSVLNSGGSPLLLRNDTLYRYNNGLSQLYTDGWPIINVNVSENKIFLSERKSTGEARVLVLNGQGVVEKILTEPGIISFPKWATTRGDEVWVADFYGGLSRHNNGAERFIPNGPLGAASGEMIFSNGTLYVAAGDVNEAWNYQYNRNGLYSFKQDYWDYKGYYNTPVLDSVLDFITLAADPVNGSIWAGSYGGGLVNMSSSPPTIYKQNSSLQPAIGDPNSYRVSGLAFDHDDNLWISNYGAAQDLHVRKPDGTFKSFTIPFFHFENAVSQLLVDDNNQLWIVSPRGNGVFVFNRGNSIDNTGDDHWKYLRVGKGSGNLPSNDVFCVAKDKNGFIWIGTAAGIALVPCPAEVFTANGCEAVLPVVQQDRFAGYLFQNEEVRTIAVDGANRKWVGTKNGVWLISPDGDNIIYRFTEDNSPLLSNDIKKIAIDPVTGEVFISTFKGICSFRSTATEATASNEKALVFPNPVPPTYNGNIAIKGLPENALIKIAELSGRLVFQSRALGGQAVWDGKNYKAEKVAAGVYLVLVKNTSGSERTVTKIVLAGRR